jgi:hypothetical protein
MNKNTLDPTRCIVESDCARPTGLILGGALAFRRLPLSENSFGAQSEAEVGNKFAAPMVSHHSANPGISKNSPPDPPGPARSGFGSGLPNLTCGRPNVPPLNWFCRLAGMPGDWDPQQVRGP